MKTEPFSLVLGREPHGALVSGKIKTTEEYSMMSPVQAKLKILESHVLLKRRAEEALPKARESFKQYFNKKWYNTVLCLRQETGSISTNLSTW